MDTGYIMNRLKLILAGVLLIFVTASIFRSQERSDRAPVQATSTVSHSEPLTGIQFIPLHTSREEVISQPVSGVLTNLYESLPEWLHGESDFLAVSNFYMRREEMGSMAVGFKPAHEIVISENADQETELAILTEKASANQTLATHAMVEGHLYEELRRELGIEKPLGEGKVNFPVFISKLIKSGYNGALTIEREISGEKQTEDIKKAINLLQSLMSNAK